VRRVEAPSYPVSIFMAGSAYHARVVCGNFCSAVGLCVTVSETTYVYRGGSETGVVIGLINYPRFPKSPAEIWTVAETLAARLCPQLAQLSYTIQAPDKTVWFSHRPEAARLTTPSQEM